MSRKEVDKMRKMVGSSFWQRLKNSSFMIDIVSPVEVSPGPLVFWRTINLHQIFLISGVRTMSKEKEGRAAAFAEKKIVVGGG